jgi:hypothetical protein
VETRTGGVEPHRHTDHVETCKLVVPFQIICGETEQNPPRHISLTSPISDLSASRATADFKLAERAELSQLELGATERAARMVLAPRFSEAVIFSYDRGGELQQHYFVLNTTRSTLRPSDTPLQTFLPRRLRSARVSSAPPRHHSPQHHRARTVATQARRLQKDDSVLSTDKDHFFPSFQLTAPPTGGLPPINWTWESWTNRYQMCKTTRNGFPVSRTWIQCRVVLP